MHNITLSLAIQGKGFFRERFQHSKSGLVCTPHRNHCALLRSRRLFLFTLVLVRILLREHLGAISGLWSLLGEGGGLLRIPGPDRVTCLLPEGAGNGGAGTMSVAWENPARGGVGPGSLSKLSGARVPQ